MIIRGNFLFFYKFYIGFDFGTLLIVLHLSSTWILFPDLSIETSTCYATGLLEQKFGLIILFVWLTAQENEQLYYLTWLCRSDTNFRYSGSLPLA